MTVLFFEFLCKRLTYFESEFAILQDLNNQSKIIMQVFYEMNRTLAVR